MSARKNVIIPYHLVQGGDMSSSFVSKPVGVQYLDNSGVQVKFSGNAVGVFSVEASINYDPVKQVGDFVELDFGGPITTDESSFLINMKQLPYSFIRVKYTSTSGSGSCDIWTTAKEL